MKRKKLNSKLKLNKEKISNLNEIKGGDFSFIESRFNCPPTWTIEVITTAVCQPTGPDPYLTVTCFLC